MCIQKFDSLKIEMFFDFSAEQPRISLINKQKNFESPIFFSYLVFQLTLYINLIFLCSNVLFIFLFNIIDLNWRKHTFIKSCTIIFIDQISYFIIILIVKTSIHFIINIKNIYFLIIASKLPIFETLSCLIRFSR